MRAGIVEMEQFGAGDGDARALRGLPRARGRVQPRPAARSPALQPHARAAPDGRGWTWKNDRRERPKLDEDARKQQWDERASLLWDAVRSIEVPTLLMRGSESKILSDEHAREVVAAMKRAELVEIPRARHTVQGDNPADFARELDAFLQRTLTAGD